MATALRLTCVLSLAACGLAAQNPAPEAMAPLLIRLHAAVLDSDGKPVTDLTAGDFKITDQGKPQTISFFRRDGVEAAAATGPHEFTNRPGGTLPHSTAILFDLLNESQTDRLDVWHQLDRSLPQIESGASVYMYLLSLEGALTPIRAVDDKSIGGQTWTQQSAKLLDKAMKSTSHARPVGMIDEEAVKKTYVALETIGNQLGTLPGRRDIIWITSSMPNAWNTKLPCNGDWVDCALYVPHLAVTLDRTGTVVNPLSYTNNPNPGVTRDIEQMALLTGGHAYFREDIAAVVKQVERDAANGYTIFYDPGADNFDNKWHKVRVNLERKGSRLHVRQRFYALPDSRAPQARLQAAMVSAYQGFRDVPDIGLRAKMSPAADQKGVHLEVRINPADLSLHESGAYFDGSATFLLGDFGASSPLGEPAVNTFSLHLTREQHDAVMKDGVPMEQDHALAAGVQKLKVIVLDNSTTTVGSLTIPVGGQ